MSNNIKPDATARQLREQGRKILEDQEKIIGQKGAKELREQGSKIKNFIVNKFQRQRDAKFIEDHRQGKAYKKAAAAEGERREAFYKLPKKEQHRLRDAEEKRIQEEEDKGTEKQQIKQFSKYQNLPKKERESIRLMQLATENTKHNIDKADLKQMKSRLKKYEPVRKEKDDAEEVDTKLEKIEKQISSPPKTRSRSRVIDAEKAEKVLQSRAAKSMSKKYKDVEEDPDQGFTSEIMTQSDDEEEPMKVINEKDLTEIQKKTLVKEENKLHSNILEESDRIHTLVAVLHQLESTNLINSSQKMSKQLKEIVMPAYTKLNIQKVHGNRDINSVYKELKKNLETSKYKKESLEEALKDLPRKTKSKGTTLNTSTATPNPKRSKL
jgi:hypothetical protein